MTTQLSLLDTGVSARAGSTPLPARARRTDPRTSKAAAASMSEHVLGKQRSEVLAVVNAYPKSHGATAFEVASCTGYQQSVCARRLTDLCELGLVLDSGKTRAGSSNR